MMRKIISKHHEMLRLLLSFAVATLVQSSCPNPDFELVKDGECRGLVDKEYLYYDTAGRIAVSMCDKLGGSPVIIHDEEHQSYWRSKAPAREDFLILGLVCNTKTRHYEWADGSPVDFRPSEGYDPELDKPCSPDYSWDIRTDGFWGYGGPGFMIKADIWCTVQLHQPVRGADGCDGFQDDSDDGECYMVSKFAARTFQDAQQTCMLFGGNLASVHNAQENSFIRRIAVSRAATYGIFLGATPQGDGTFGWIDGSPMDYNNYAPGFPNPSEGDCLSMDTFSTPGQWKNVNCSSGLPAACVRDQRPVADPVCIPDGYKENTIIASPGFPFDSSTPCDYVLSVPAGRKVQVKINSLEANSCCDRLIIYDGSVGGTVLANLTGGSLAGATYATRKSNVMVVSWQPQGGVNVMGFTMTYGEI